MKTMRAAVFQGKDQIRVEEIERPHAGFGEAVIRVSLTTICGTDLHILRDGGSHTAADAFIFSGSNCRGLQTFRRPQRGRAKGRD